MSADRWVVMVLVDDREDFDAITQEALLRNCRVAVTDDDVVCDLIEAQTIACGRGDYVILKGFLAYGDQA